MTLAHTTIGEGDRPTALLHGFLGSGRNLAALARAYAGKAPGRRFFLFDLPGHGASPALPEGATLETLATLLLQSFTELALPTPVDVIGHSLGGRVALKARQLAPERLGAVTLLDIGPSPITLPGTSHLALQRLLAAPERAPTREAFREALQGPGLTPGLVDWLLMNVVRDGDAFRWRIDRAALDRLHPRVNAEDLWPAVRVQGGALRCIRGEHGGYVSDADLAGLSLLGVDVVTLAGAGHFLHVDAPDALLQALPS